MTKDEALKLALEALENISTALREDDVLGSDSELMLNAITAIKEALAQPAQEPVAWINAEKRTFEWNGPVLWNTPTVASLNKIPLYTAPQQRPWVGLTELERAEIANLKWWDWEDSFDIEGFARAIEAKLREKNT
jgi:hypothetical protein